MKVLIISTNRSAFPVSVLPVGPCIVAEAAERAGHTVHLLDLMFDRSPLRSVEAKIRGGGYDLIGVSVRNIDNNDMHSPGYYIPEVLSVVDAVRRATKAPVVLGGSALTVMPEEILRASGADLAVIGDGEAVFPKLLGQLSGKGRHASLPGTALLENGIYRSNPPDHRLPGRCSAPIYERWIDLEAYRSHLATIPLQSKLGCQFRCIYCTYRKIEGDVYRVFDPKEVAEASKRYVFAGLNDIEFVDNVFNAPYGHALSVCEELIRAKTKARFQSLELNPAYFSKDLLIAMQRAGFVGFGMTVESASDRVLKGLKKGFSSDDVRKAAEVVRSSPLPCVWIFMLGGPEETRETVKETLSFAERVTRPRDAAFFTTGIRIYPGTELEALARAQGVLSLPEARMLPPVFYVSPEVDADWIRLQVKIVMRRHMNFMSGDSLGFRYLPMMHRIGHRLGITPPLWKYTRYIRRGLRTFGMDV